MEIVKYFHSVFDFVIPGVQIAQKSEKVMRVLGRGQRAPSQSARDLGERCMLPHWGLWQSPNRKEF